MDRGIDESAICRLRCPCRCTNVQHAGAHLGWQQCNAHDEVESIGSRPAVTVTCLPAAACHALHRPALAGAALRLHLRRLWRLHHPTH